jgi:hypothetical protein
MQRSLSAFFWQKIISLTHLSRLSGLGVMVDFCALLDKQSKKARRLLGCPGF